MVQVKRDSRNVGKRVRFTITRGRVAAVREGTILRLRGASAAWVGYTSPSGQYRVTCFERKNLEYV